MHAPKVFRPWLAPTMWFVLVLLLIAASWTGVVMLVEYLLDRAQ